MGRSIWELVLYGSRDESSKLACVGGGWKVSVLEISKMIAV